ncbi:hypothetical protein H261_12804 [Paramagnetospirillum caucaseum]|uniref:Insertion element IS402-like domain-containing protein n=1 Tax=Paramagnetospirillum caucaseum TaxID=1244869 RepID=M3A9S8_9PROT|nr:hypothetical protein H261_12804 [Paramagnetospirillum caucaseum]
MARFDLSDKEWDLILPLLPNKPRGVARTDDRRVLNGIFYILRTGSPWRDLPERYGPYTTAYRGRPNSLVRRSSSSTARLLALLLCNSRQTAPSPMASRRRFTTSSAAIFSATNSTLRPPATAPAIRLAMVWDLPVPGGPWITRLRPRRTSSMARVWELSASMTWIWAEGGT